MIDGISIPVIAAGGIADARGVVAAFSLGAEGVQLGTRFVAVNENDSPPARLHSLKTQSAQRFLFGFDLPLRGVASQKRSAWRAVC